MGRGLALVFAPEFPQPPANADPQGHLEQKRFWGGRDREVTRVTCGRPGSRPLKINCSSALARTRETSSSDRTAGHVLESDRVHCS